MVALGMVLVELFTSEGCSSCPPADQLLAQLERSQAEVIVLSEHVDYWDRLGWRDPFSSPEFTDRQQQYARTLNQESSYTPEMVVDGRRGFVGSDAAKARAAIAEAATQPKATVTLSVPDGRNADVNITGIPAKKADVFLAITESGLRSHVMRGENSGRDLPHTGVVRRLTLLGQAKGGSYQGHPSLSVPPEWNRSNLRAVVFVQDPSTRRILGAGAAALQSR